MTTPFEVGAQERLHHLPSQFVRYETTRQGKDVSIVVLTRQFGQFHIPAQRSSHVMMMVSRHLGTITATTKDDTQGILADCDSRSKRMDEIGIVDTLIAIGAKIVNSKTGLCQFLNQKLLHLEAAMIARYGYDAFHFFRC